MWLAVLHGLSLGRRSLLSLLPVVLLVLGCSIQLCGAVQIRGGATAQEGSSSEMEPEDNPYAQEIIRPPPAAIPKITPPWNIFEIPELPTTFVVKFIWNNKYEGRWVYDYPTRKTLIEFYTSENSKQGFFMNYQFLQEKLLQWQDAGSLGGEQCNLFDLIDPYHRMFSPRSFRRIEVSDVSFQGMSVFEADRQKTVTVTSGFWDTYDVAFYCYSNGTFKELIVGPDIWKFYDFKDLSALDNSARDKNQALQDLHPPDWECVYAGGLTREYARTMQHKIPYLLLKPTRRDLKAISEYRKKQQQAESGGEESSAESSSEESSAAESSEESSEESSGGNLVVYLTRPTDEPPFNRLRRPVNDDDQQAGGAAEQQLEQQM